MMKKLFVLAGLAATSAPALAADAAAAMEIAKKNNCLACHALDKKLVGPSFKDIGAKYAGVAGAEADLVTKVKKGTKGTWGPMPMPANATVKDADIKTVVQYILTLK